MNLTLDGSGQQVTLDGRNSVRVLLVNSGVSFTLNALTIAHGFTDIGGSAGGGLYNNGTVSISNSTFAYNGSGLLNLGTAKIGGSIVADNGSADFECMNGGTFPSSQGYNLSDDSSCDFTGTDDLQNTDPKLAPSGLQNNGGPTQTLALLDGSPAINQIPASSCPSTDQRGISRPQGPACDIGAFEFRVPVLRLPGTITTNATSSRGALVSYTVSASEPDDASATPAVSCAPASGSTFPVGTTTVTCSASDAANPPDVTSGSFQVVVVEQDLGLSNMPANQTVDATRPQGAVVTYSLPTVVDEDSPLPSANCSPASGSTFAIGPTTVTCTVSDSDDSNSPVSQSFTVTVNGFQLPGNVSKSFISQL